MHTERSTAQSPQGKPHENLAGKYRPLKSSKVDDVFVVVDCGGGTVDLISYQIMALHPNLEIKECAVGTGGMCGSTYINNNFENFVRSRIMPE